jgi:hypothetical protein
MGLNLGRYALCSCIAAATLAGCGGSQPPIGAPGVMPQSAARSGTLPPSTSLTKERLPKSDSSASQSGLIYASSKNETYIVTFPEGKILTQFAVFGPPSLCSDRQGNVFFPGRNVVTEYAHGGTSPIGSLDDSGFSAWGCASDPKTGNFAVTNNVSLPSYGPGSVAIFQKGSGEPKFLTDPSITSYFYCTYDAHGNLFVVGDSQSTPFALAELPYGSQTFTNISVSKPVPSFGEIHWDRHYLALAANLTRVIYRLSVSGSTATVIGTTALRRIEQPRRSFALQDDTVVTPTTHNDRRLGFWKYPSGKLVKTVGPFFHRGNFLGALTISTGSGKSLAPK